MKRIELELSDDHYNLIERCARREGKTMENWIIRYTEGPLRDFADSVPFLREDEVTPVFENLTALDS